MQFIYYKNDKKDNFPICLEKFNKNISKICTTPFNYNFYRKKEYLKDNNFNFYGIKIIPLNENK